MTSSTAQAPVNVPTPNPWVLLLQSLILTGLSAAGITDTALPTLVRAACPPAVALVLAVLFAAHHWSLRGAQGVTHDLALWARESVRDVADGAPLTVPTGVRVSAENFAQVVTAIGAYVESARQGVPAAGPRHAAALTDPAPTAVLRVPARLPVTAQTVDPADPILAGLTDTTVAAGTLPPVPTPGA